MLSVWIISPAWSLSYQNNVLHTHKNDRRQETSRRVWERPFNVLWEQIKSAAEFQSFPGSFRSLSTDLEMLINHLLMAERRLAPLLHFWWIRFKNRHSSGKLNQLSGCAVLLSSHFQMLWCRSLNVWPFICAMSRRAVCPSQNKTCKTQRAY